MEKREHFAAIGFDENETAYTYNEKTKLDKYLDDPRIDRKIKVNILDFWRENESQYGELAHLARDILSVPLTTVTTESTFSIGGRVLSKWRSSYLPENIEAWITTRSWLYGFEATEEDEYVGCNVGWDGANPLLDILNKVHRASRTGDPLHPVSSTVAVSNFVEEMTRPGVWDLELETILRPYIVLLLL